MGVRLIFVEFQFSAHCDEFRRMMSIFIDYMHRRWGCAGITILNKSWACDVFVCILELMLRGSHHFGMLWKCNVFFVLGEWRRSLCIFLNFTCCCRVLSVNAFFHSTFDLENLCHGNKICHNLWWMPLIMLSISPRVALHDVGNVSATQHLTNAGVHIDYLHSLIHETFGNVVAGCLIGGFEAIDHPR